MDARALLPRVRWPWRAGLLVPVAAVLLAWLLFGRGDSGAGLTYRVTRGPFVVTEIQGGETQASRGEQIVSPDISGQAKAQQDQRLGDLTRQIEQQQAQLELARLSRHQRPTCGSPIDQQRSQI